MLGCGDWRVFITERGGTPILDEMPWQDVFMGRVLDDSSNATVNVPIAGSETAEECCASLKDVEPWAHELNIFRDGELAWVGPVTDLQINDDLAVISARDLFVWFERRIFTEDASFFGDVGTIFQRYAEITLSIENSMGMSVFAQETGTVATRTILGSERRRVADELRELARTDIDFTALGRVILAGKEIPGTETLKVWQPSLRTAFLNIRGLDMETEVTVTGVLPGVNTENEIVQTVGGTDTRYGLLQSHQSELGMEDEVSALTMAQNRHDFLSTPPKYLTVSFDPAAPFTFNQLIPGSRCDVRAVIGCFEVIGEMRLQSLGVSVNATAGGGLSESVNGTLTPLGAVEIEVA